MNPPVNAAEVAGPDQNVDAAQAIAAAVAQVELAVRDVQAPVEQLGILINNMAEALGQLREARLGNADPDSIRVFPDPFDVSIRRLEQELKDGIVQLQFNDRLVQHLGHIQDFLSAIAEQLASGGDASSHDVWGQMRDRLRTRLISAAQRQLLDVVLPPSEGAQFTARQAREEHAAQGTIELF